MQLAVNGAVFQAQPLTAKFRLPPPVLPECRLAGFPETVSGEVAFPDTALRLLGQRLCARRRQPGGAQDAVHSCSMGLCRPTQNLSGLTALAGHSGFRSCGCAVVPDYRRCGLRGGLCTGFGQQPLKSGPKAADCRFLVRELLDRRLARQSVPDLHQARGRPVVYQPRDVAEPSLVENAWAASFDTISEPPEYFNCTGIVCESATRRQHGLGEAVGRHGRNLSSKRFFRILQLPPGPGVYFSNAWASAITALRISASVNAANPTRTP
jgi:hypothetical protein